MACSQTATYIFAVDHSTLTVCNNIDWIDDDKN